MLPASYQRRMIKETHFIVKNREKIQSLGKEIIEKKINNPKTDIKIKKEDKSSRMLLI